MYLYHFTLQSYEACHLEAICGISEDQPAMLIVYQESTLTERVIIRKIPFTCVKNVGQVEDRHRMINVINFQEDDDEFLFYGESATSTEKWFGCCWLLLSLPSHFIPIVPEENLVPQNLIDEYSNNHILDAGRFSLLLLAVHAQLGVVECQLTQTVLLQYFDDPIITL